jgi:hypothetical protein
MNSLSSRAKVARSSGDQPARARLVHTERVGDPGHGDARAGVRDGLERVQDLEYRRLAESS